MTPAELIESATGSPPSPEPFLNYVEEKYLQIVQFVITLLRNYCPCR